MTPKTLAMITDDRPRVLKEAIDVLYWTLVEACEMNPDMKNEIQSAWSTILDEVDKNE